MEVLSGCKSQFAGFREVNKIVERKDDRGVTRSESHFLDARELEQVFPRLTTKSGEYMEHPFR